MTTEAIRAMAEEADVAICRSGALGSIVLNRPRVLNAITDDMRTRIAGAIPDFARDPNVYAVMIRSSVPNIFSAGGDLRELAALAVDDRDGACRLMSRKYALHWLLECFSKPTVSLIDGPVMGAGVGLSIYGTHRVAGDNYAFAMPETGIGFFPDDGLASVFSRMPGEVGLYLALTGRSIGRADAFGFGLVTHCIPAARFATIEEGLSAADPVDALLDDLHEDPGVGELADWRELIESCFGAPTLEDVFIRLESQSRCGGEAGAWCESTLAELRRRSPTSLKVTFRHIRESEGRDLRQTLMVDYRLASRFLGSRDFREGIRAMLIDKDNAPRWFPDRIETVSEAMVQSYFAFDPGNDLNLPTRQEMQAARV